ncbi:YbaB/EbfC family nucleoid-associated protein [Amycolatopsis circi]|uniref:YbaB/EbfC family nucleoid-associated protein n=1 Tax=Amycolatopsis circi TaxID=871959 RepID=UPI000E2789AB|nr:YbaB/EbfC family nucleoid-associated protein [Amycolatopsis circi]
MDDQGWLDDFQRRIDEMQAKSVALQETLSTAEGRAKSGDGLVSVSVAPNGALKNLEIDDRALRHGGARLTASIMDAYGKAQRQVSRDVIDAFEPIAGDSEMMNVVKSYLPEPEEEPEPPAEPPRSEPPARYPGPPPGSTTPPGSAAYGRPMPPPGGATHSRPPMPPPGNTPPPPAAPEAPRPTSGPHRRRAAGEDDDEMQPW